MVLGPKRQGYPSFSAPASSSSCAAVKRPWLAASKSAVPLVPLPWFRAWVQGQMALGQRVLHIGSAGKCISGLLEAWVPFRFAFARDWSSSCTRSAWSLRMAICNAENPRMSRASKAALASQTVRAERSPQIDSPSRALNPQPGPKPYPNKGPPKCPRVRASTPDLTSNPSGPISPKPRA